MPVHPEMNSIVREGFWDDAKAYFECAYESQRREREFWQQYERDMARPPYVKE